MLHLSYTGISVLPEGEDLGLEHLWVVYPGHQEYAIDAKISVIPLDLISCLADLR